MSRTFVLFIFAQLFIFFCQKIFLFGKKSGSKKHVALVCETF